jgi:hypothetical protein
MLMLMQVTSLYRRTESYEASKGVESFEVSSSGSRDCGVWPGNKAIVL